MKLASSLFHLTHDPLRKQRKFVNESSAQSLSNSRCDGRRRPVNWHLANTLCLIRSGVRIRKLDELYLNIRRIGAGRNDVVRELRVLHGTLFENDIFIERKTHGLSDSALDLAGRQRGIDHA